MKKIISIVLSIVISFSFHSQVKAQTSFSLNSSMTCSLNPIPQGSYISVVVNIHNSGSSDSYDFEMDFDNSSGGYLTVVQKICSQYITSGANTSLTFYSNNAISYSPGSYKIYLKASHSSCSGCANNTGTCYNNVSSGSGSNPLNISIVSASCTPVGITSQPQNQTANVGGTATFNVSVNGTSTYNYFWYKGTTLVSSLINSSSTTSSYTTPTLAIIDNGNCYHCIITNCSSTYQAISNDACLTVTTSCTTPTTQANNISFSSVGTTSMIVNWVNGSGSRRVVKINTSNSFTAPSNGTDPTANSNYGGGQQVVYNSSSNSVTVTGLSSGTTYWFRVYEANCTGASSVYKTSTAANNPKSQATQSSCVTPTTQVSSISFSSIGIASMNVNWVIGSGSRRVVMINTSNNFTAPTNGTDPTANSNYGGAGQQVVYNSGGNNIAVTGLSANTTYWFRIYEANCSGSSSLYKTTTTTGNPNSQITLGVNPIINSITFTNKITYVPGLSDITLYSGSPTNTNNPIKICTDGSTATYFKVNVSNTSGIGFRILDENGQPSTDISKYGSIGTPYIFGSNVEAAFTHPQLMDLNQLYRSCTLQVTYNGNPIAGINFPIHFYRAPILMIHGLWGDKSTFQDFEVNLITQGLYPGNVFTNHVPYGVNENTNYLTYRVDYESTNDVHFNQNQNVIINGRIILFNKVRSNNFSVGKMIVIAHSMGGILAKQYLQSINYKNEIQKLVTLNTPYYGSQMANYLLWNDGNQGWPDNSSLRFTLNALGMNTKKGAVEDLKVNSSAISNLNISTYYQNKVPTHTISSKQDENIVQSNGLCRGIIFAAANAYSVHNVFNSEYNDNVVAVSSQKSGINLSNTFDDQCHMGAASNLDIQNLVKNLINSDPNDNTKFTSGGFIPSSLPEPQPNPATINNFNQPYFTTNNDSIKILTPTNNQIFSPGANVSVSIQGYGNVSEILFGGGNENLLPDIHDSTTGHLVYTYQIPNNAIGKINLVGLGGDSINFKCIDTIKIIVSTTAMVDSIFCEPNVLNISSGFTGVLKVKGYFNDGIIRDITTEPSLQFATDTSIAKHIGNSVFLGKNSGDAIITVTYNGKTSLVPVHVIADTSLLIAGIGSDITHVCNGSSVNFINESTSFPVSIQWQFPGGTPSTSTLQNPAITYNTSGTYSVTMIATYPNKIDTITLSNYITVEELPIMSGSISVAGGTGDVSPCDIRTYSIPTIAGAVTYNWVIPNGSTIISGNGTNSISLSFTYNFSESGLLSVTACNSCGCSIPDTLTVFRNSIESQAPKWLWAKTTESNSSIANSVTTDVSGNILVVGNFNSTITFGTTTLTHKGMFVVKYDSNGNAIWAKDGIGGSNNNYNASDARAATIDGNGNIIVVGYFRGSTITFGTTTLINSSATGVNYDVFIVKYDANGNVIWAKSAGGTSYDIANSVKTDGLGNILMAGSFDSFSITFGAFTLINDSVGFDDMFIVKYDPNGNVSWAKSAGGGYYDRGNSLAIDSTGNVFVVGYFGSLSITFGSIVLNKAGSEDIFVVKYDANGNVIWAKSALGMSSERAQTVATDNSGNVLVAGYFYGSSITFGSTVLINQSSFQIGHDMFIAKYDPNGNIIWAKSATSSSNIFANSLTTDESNNILIAGKFPSPYITFGSTNFVHSGNMFIAKYTLNGDFLWVQSAGGSGDEANSVSTDEFSNILVSGIFGGVANFGSNILSTQGNPGNMFIAKMGPAKPNFKIVNDASTILGNTITINSTVINDGLDTANSDTYMGWYLSTDTTISLLGGTDDIIIGTTLINPLPPGGTQTFNLSIDVCNNINSVPIGTYYFGYRADCINQTDETNENDNAFLKHTPTISVTCPTPTSISSSNITGTTAIISWIGNSCAAKYRLQYRKQGVTTWTTKLITTPTSTKTLTSLLELTTYEYRIRTDCNSAGTIGSAFSAIQTFTTTCTCAKPTNISVTGISQTSATINWTGNVCAYQYRLQYRKTGTTAWTTKTILAPTATKVLTGLTANTNYQYHIRTDCNSTGSVNSGFTTTTTFTTALRLEDTNASVMISEFTINPNPCSTCEIIGDVNSDDLILTDIVGRIVAVDFNKTSNGYEINFMNDETGFFIIRSKKTGQVVKFMRE